MYVQVLNFSATQTHKAVGLSTVSTFGVAGPGPWALMYLGYPESGYETMS